MTVTIVAVMLPLVLCWVLIIWKDQLPRLEVPDVPRGVPLLRDWRPVWAEKILLQSSIRTSILDGLCTEMFIHLLHDITVIGAASQLGGTQILAACIAQNPQGAF